ncbi:MAG: dockerin type I repeat-containing protein [Candidatus Zixiibacteriota bacterium]
MKRRNMLFILVMAYLLMAWMLPTQAIACSGVAGDVNNDGFISVADLIYLYNYIYRGGPPPPCLDQADANGDCFISMADYLYLYNYIFYGGPAPKFC